MRLLEGGSDRGPFPRTRQRSARRCARGTPIRGRWLIGEPSHLRGTSFSRKRPPPLGPYSRNMFEAPCGVCVGGGQFLISEVHLKWLFGGPRRCSTLNSDVD